MIKGKKVRLRPVEREDIMRLWKWLNDEEVMHWWGNPSNAVSLAELEHQFDRRFQNPDPDTRAFIIETDQGQAIGWIMYFRRQFNHLSAELGIQIGEKEFWSQGYGTDALMAFLGYLFCQLNLHRVQLRVLSHNARAIRIYAKCGFIKEGQLRQDRFIDGAYHDDLIMGLLKEEFLDHD